jgi:hypothetical protein
MVLQRLAVGRYAPMQHFRQVRYQSFVMKLFNFTEVKIFSAVVISLAAAIFLFSQAAVACSWDYPIWQPRSKNADPLYRFIKGDKAGYIDRTGKVVIEPTLEFYGNYHGEFQSGLLNLLSWEGPYIDQTGKIVIANDYYRTYGFSEGLAVAVKNDGEKAGFIDKTGKFVINPGVADSLENFSEGLARATVKNLDGYINRKGEFVIQPQFLQGGDFSDGMARVIVEGPCAYFDYDDPCAIVNPLQNLPDRKDNAELPRCKFTFINRAGKIITTERFDRAGNFSEGLAAVRKDEKWGFIDKTGKMVIPPQFDAAANFSEETALVKKGELWGYINKSSKFAIEPRFLRAASFYNGLALIGKNWNQERFDYDDYYFINQKGEPAFPETFFIASDYFKGLAHVKLKTEKSSKQERNYRDQGTFAYIDTTDKKVFVYERDDSD